MSDYLDRFDELQAHLSQLQAMVEVTYCERGEAFRNLSEKIQDAFMWAISDKVELAESAAREAHEAYRAEKGFTS